jgi:Alpha/beta hydrolase domain
MASTTEPGEAFTDIDEQREHPMPHRYVHGGFGGTHTLFSLYFPPAEKYKGRFFQYLEGGSGGHENLITVQKWLFRLAFEDLGGYLVESNQGHYPNEGMGFANDWELFGASAETAVFARKIAAEIYGEAPHHGYVWGGSGGGSRAIYCLENRPDVYDGGSPHVIWSSPLGSNWSPVGEWWLRCRHALGDLVDAVEPGGSGDPYENLTAGQREAMAALYRFGYPRGAESQLWSFSPWTWGFAGYRLTDPAYFEDFWTKPGYLGHDDMVDVAPLVVDFDATVTRTLTGAEAPTDIAVLAATAGAGRDDHNVGIAIDAEVDDPDQLFGATLHFTSGQAAGRSVIVSMRSGELLSTSGEHAPELFDGVEVGDTVHVDNRDFVAWCHLWRHTLTLDLMAPRGDDGKRHFLEGFEGMRAYTIDDEPLFPQRAALVPQEGGGTGHSGRYSGRMIHVNATHDAQVWPNGVVAYRAKVRRQAGDAIGERYRLWWVEHAPHGAPQILGPALTPEKDPGVWQSRLVDYDGVTAQALRDLVAWVEEEVAPPTDTSFTMTNDGRIALEVDAVRRGGVQPVVVATANGGTRANVKVGEPVRLVGTAQQVGPGTIVAAEWDALGNGGWEPAKVDGVNPSVTVETTHAYEQPGTYFASFRAGSHRDGSAGNKPYARNLARVRVVVTAHGSTR